MTKRQWEVARAFVEGLDDEQIARRYGRSLSNIRTLISEGAKRANVTGREGLRALVLAEGWLDAKTMPPVPYGCPLSQTYWEVVYLHFERKCSYVQIARLLGLTRSCVQMRFLKARRKLGVATNHEAVRLMTERSWLDAVPPPEPEPEDEFAAAMRSYLAAFDEFLRARGVPTLRRARALMRLQLAVMFVVCGRAIPERPYEIERVPDKVLWLVIPVEDRYQLDEPSRRRRRRVGARA